MIATLYRANGDLLGKVEIANVRDYPEYLLLYTPGYTPLLFKQRSMSTSEYLRIENVPIVPAIEAGGVPDAAAAV